MLIIDAKYKEKVTDDDINQMWIYCISFSIPLGILIYPKHSVSLDEIQTLRKIGSHALVKSIDLNKKTYQEFEQECNKFAYTIENIIKSGPCDV